MLILQPMKNQLLIVISVFILTSCGGQKEDTIPPYVLSQQKMVTVTADLKLIEGAVNLSHLNKNTQGHTTHQKHI